MGICRKESLSEPALERREGLDGWSGLFRLDDGLPYISLEQLDAVHRTQGMEAGGVPPGEEGITAGADTEGVPAAAVCSEGAGKGEGLPAYQDDGRNWDLGSGAASSDSRGSPPGCGRVRIS